MTAVPGDAEVVRLLRERLHTLENAVEAYYDVVERTGKERVAAWEGVQEALRCDFKTAVLAAWDMSDEDRARWLSEACPRCGETEYVSCQRSCWDEHGVHWRTKELAARKQEQAEEAAR